MNAGDAVLHETALEGRHWVAGRNISEVGRAIYQNQAHVIAIHEEFVELVCANCFAVARSGPLSCMCDHCECTFYCSSQCRAQHDAEASPGRAAHHHTCGVLRRLKSLDTEARLVVEALARRHGPPHDSSSVAADVDALQPAAAASSNASPPWWCADVRNALRACAWGRAVPEAELTDAALCALAGRFELNGFGCSTHEMGFVGLAVYLGGANLFNHDCEPTCEVVHSMPALSIRTTRQVKTGARLTISYVDTEADLTTRREALRAQYGFTCGCARCISEEEAEAAEAARLARRPRWVLNEHRQGTHYYIAGALASAGYYEYAFLWLFTYFFVWLVVLRYPI